MTLAKTAPRTHREYRVSLMSSSVSMVLPVSANDAARISFGFGEDADDAFSLLRFELDVAGNFQPFEYIVDRVYIEHIPEHSVLNGQIASPVGAIRHHHNLGARQSGLGRTRSDAGILQSNHGKPSHR